MQNDGVDFREDINVILNAPKVGFRTAQLLLSRVHVWDTLLFIWHNGLPTDAWPECCPGNLTGTCWIECHADAD